MNVLYVRLEKDLYVLLHRAIIFHIKLVTDLKNDSFSLNPYEICVMNKLVNG